MKIVTEMRPGAGLAWENQVVIQLVQALLGMVSQPQLGVAIEFDGDALTLHFAVSELTDELQSDIAEVVADLEGGLWPLTPRVSSRVYVGSAENNGGWEGRQHRLVYLAKS